MCLIPKHYFGVVGGGELGGKGSTLGHRQPAVPMHKNRETLVVFLSKAQNALFASKNRVYPKIARFFHRGDSGFAKRAFQKKVFRMHGTHPSACGIHAFFMVGPYKNGDPLPGGGPGGGVRT